MNQNHILQSALSLFLFLATFASAQATVVRMEIAFGDDPNTEDIYIELFDTADGARTAAPITVDNFLNNYVEDSEGNRRYDGTFIHRSVPGFIVQGGGFSFFPEPRIDSVQTELPIVNEFHLSRSNERGTIAMAKTGAGPDTATSQWFFNLFDNNSPLARNDLDNDNGGFTVFGRVIGNGMLFVDRIATLRLANFGTSTFSAVPFTRTILDSDGVTPIPSNDNLVEVSRVEVFTVPETARLSLSEKYQIGFGDLGPGLTQDLEFSVANLGNSTLNFSLQFTGPNASSFSSTNACTDVAFGESCTETLTFTPTSVGQLDVQLEITTDDDPDSPSVLVPVDAFASGDNDGVSDDIEAAGPNNGDSNNDGIADTLQDYVTTFLNENGRYVSLETSPGLEFTQVQFIDNPSPFNTPRSSGAGTTLNFDQGFYAFNIENVAIGGTATVTMTLPPGSNQNIYFKYGQAPGQAFQSWYLFDFDGTTGAEFQGNQVILHYVDGGRGDDDGLENGVIVDPGGPASLSQNGGSSGGGGCTLPTTVGQIRFPIDFVLLLSGLLMLRRYRNQRQHTP